MLVSHLFSVFTDSFFIEPLSPNPFLIKYFQPITLEFQVAVLSDGLSNAVNRIMLKRPGSIEPSFIRSIQNSSQVFAEEVGFAGSATAGIYTACEHKRALNCLIFDQFILMQHLCI